MFSHFSRKQPKLSSGGLQLTFCMLRKQSPALALTVRNICTVNHLQPKAKDNLYSINLNLNEIRSIIENLQLISLEVNDHNNYVLTKALIEDWFYLLEESQLMGMSKRQNQN